MPPLGVPCAVCSQAASKYKCPKCRAPYCAVACFKAHKADAAACREPPKPPPAPAAPPPKRKFEEEAGDSDAGARLHRAQLARVASSPAVRAALSDGAFRELVAGVDAAPDAETALDAALAIPAFARFADCLRAAIGTGPEPA